MARFSVPRAEIAPRLALLTLAPQGPRNFSMSRTCNRIEVVFRHRRRRRRRGCRAGGLPGALAGPRRGRPARRHALLRAWTGEAAVEHLFPARVRPGFGTDGRRREIAAQLRVAWEDARHAHTCGPVLDRLMGEALTMARRVQRLSGGVRARLPWAISPPSACSGTSTAARLPGGAGRGLAHDPPLRIAAAAGAGATAHRQPHAAGRRRTRRRGGR